MTEGKEREREFSCPREDWTVRPQSSYLLMIEEISTRDY